MPDICTTRPVHSICRSRVSHHMKYLLREQYKLMLCLCAVPAAARIRACATIILEINIEIFILLHMTAVYIILQMRQIYRYQLVRPGHTAEMFWPNATINAAPLQITWTIKYNNNHLQYQVLRLKLLRNILSFKVVVHIGNCKQVQKSVPIFLIQLKARLVTSWNFKKS